MEKQTFRAFSGGQTQQSCSRRSPPPHPGGSFDLRRSVFPNEFQNPAVAGGYWAGPGVFQQQAPPPAQQMTNMMIMQRADRVQTESSWSSLSFTASADAHHGGADTPGYRAPFPPYQHGFPFRPPSSAASTMRDVFDPSRPPLPPLPPPPLPFRSEPSPGHGGHGDAAQRLPDPASRVQYTTPERLADPAQQGRGGPRAQVGGHDSFSRDFNENSGAHLSQFGFGAHGYAHTFRERSAGDRYGPPEVEAPRERWHPDHQENPGWQDDGHPKDVRPPHTDAETAQRRLDRQWLSQFMLDGKLGERATSKHPDGDPSVSISRVRETLYGADRLVSQLSLVCQALKQNTENESFWTDSYAKATEMRDELQRKLSIFGDPSFIDVCKKKAASLRKKRARIRRRRNELAQERKEKEARVLEKEAFIDKWRMKRIHEAEEKKRELELREAADSVLSEVRKKQADAKRMLDILRSLEKLRKLRKEAAARKGVYPEKEADETFDSQVDRLRKLIQKRTTLYAAEEKALRVMLEGEQEQERKRELEKRQRKEREKQLQKKREVEAMLFGDEMPPDHPLQPFRQYYCQAELSLHTLIQARREWDQYLVPADHPDGSCIPEGWVLPEAPSDDTWGTALDKQDHLTD